MNWIDKVKLMEMEIRKMEVVRLDVVEKDELMACSPRIKNSLGRKVGVWGKVEK